MTRAITLGIVGTAVVWFAAGQQASAQYGGYRAGGYNPLTGRAYASYGRYNGLTGGYAQGSAYRNPYSGAVGGSKSSYNALTGRNTAGVARYNPLTGRGYAAKAYRNPVTGRYGYKYGYRR